MKIVNLNKKPDVPLSNLFKEFFDSEKAGGIILIFCTIISIILANSYFSTAYSEFWLIKVGILDLRHWINDGLMVIFFLLIGLELEREIYFGELSSLKNTLLPVSGAIGGMIIPAGLYLIFNFGTSTQSGFGIPMATDIAFAIGVLSLLGNKVPGSLKIFLIALAIVDDLGAIIIIAIFYSKTIIISNLVISLIIFGVLLILNRLKIKNLIPYIIGGTGMWYFMANSGVHTTISGVLLAFAIPFGKGDSKSPSYILQHFLHKPVAFIILPIFVLANTAIDLSGEITSIFSKPYGLGILSGLMIGKPLGITLFCYLVVKSGFSRLPTNINWKHIMGAGLLAGIGFTMSIFITLLAFDESIVINNAKFAILFTSLLAGSLGYISLKYQKTDN